MEEKNNYIELMNNEIKNLFKNALRISLRNPSLAYFILRTIRWQKKAANVRRYWESQDIHVPPFMIASITKRCNLKCKGCYAHVLNHSSASEMSNEQLMDVIKEASDLGISIILLAGGEPFVRPEILGITRHFPNIIFPIFTNGLLINDNIEELRKQKNVIPVISMEGFEKETDQRRGKGTYGNIQKIIKKVKGKRIFFGVSLTVTRDNFSLLTSDYFIKALMNAGCKLLFFVEYVPVEEGTENLVITDDQRKKLDNLLNKFRSQYNGLFIAFPGYEKKFGGCLSAGRGFVHVSPEGNLEPCPFAPYSDTCLKNLSLKEALQSEFLRKIRQSPEHLSETETGCALWNNRDWVRSLLQLK